MSKFLNYVIYVTIFSLPLYIIRGQVLGIPFTFLEVLILLTFGFWLVKVVVEKDFKSIKDLFTDKRLISVWLFLIAGIISVFVSPFFFLSFCLARSRSRNS
ncbi:MAG: hypothetical protein UR87_C0028G0003 [candidate division CPR3 bacterium GW2011_GWE2_35_7]|nr:MAG: hypothetical protein UR87_C0028G0003 [candidate division CPR3 bacterium GW2011_GWE2_35_7]